MTALAVRVCSGEFIEPEPGQMGGTAPAIQTPGVAADAHPVDPGVRDQEVAWAGQRTAADQTVHDVQDPAVGNDNDRLTPMVGSKLLQASADALV